MLTINDTEKVILDFQGLNVSKVFLLTQEHEKSPAAAVANTSLLQLDETETDFGNEEYI